MENPREMDQVASKLTRPVNKATEGIIPKLEKMTKPQLLELRDRQMHLLQNKNRLQRLPDRGRRIQEMHERIEKRLRELDTVEEAARMFSDLNIASRGQKSLTNLEWTGKCHPQMDYTVDSDDDEAPDPLKVLAQSRNLAKTVKIVKETPLITQEDLKEIKSFSDHVQKPPQSDESRSASSMSGTSADLDAHAALLCEKEQSREVKSKFRPYQTTKSDVHKPEAEMERRARKQWDLSAVAPPQLTHPGVKMLSLHESLELQLRKQEELKTLERQQAEARLQKSLKMVSSDFQAKDLSQFFKTYREVPESDSLSDLSASSESLALASDDEVQDIDAVEPSGGVVVKFSQ
ncbi:uncharacterized protein LOC132265412 [Phlebotomus argentipes]|uniref:uncharacterized protein LOC132265412 n=1 Tax=Phlebotomus argentipes TaxID=94469 RepID=UPI002892FAFA|nr:uncharacterized protein LOC132265412 [Phlebotomus argentipes]